MRRWRFGLMGLRRFWGEWVWVESRMGWEEVRSLLYACRRMDVELKVMYTP